MNIDYLLLSLAGSIIRELGEGNHTIYLPKKWRAPDGRIGFDTGWILAILYGVLYGYLFSLMIPFPEWWVYLIVLGTGLCGAYVAELIGKMAMTWFKKISGLNGSNNIKP